MNPAFKRRIAIAALAPALMLAQPALGQTPQQPRSAQPGEQRHASTGDISMYRNMWSADEMIDTDVRGANGEDIGEVKDILVKNSGEISRVLVEVGGFLELGDQHIGVPWKDVRIGRNMEWIQVPLREVESGTYSLYGRIPQGEQVLQSAGEWRVNELIGDFAQLQDVPRYGIVSDVIFDTQGRAQVVVISRPEGSWGRAGWFAYPYHGFYPGTYAYALPYLGSKVGNAGVFSYAQLAKQSPYSNPRNARVIPAQQRR